MAQTTLERRVRVIPATKSAPASGPRHGGKQRVAAYCWVSTDSEEQLNSYAAQKNYYTQKIEEKDYENELHLKAWLMRVAINRAKDITSSFWRKNKVAWEDYMSELAFEEPEDSSLFEAVMRLPEKYRTVIHLFYYEEYAVDEIANILRRPAGTVKSQLSRGKMLLKNMLQEGWTDDE